MARIKGWTREQWRNAQMASAEGTDVLCQWGHEDGAVAQYKYGAEGYDVVLNGTVKAEVSTRKEARETAADEMRQYNQEDEHESEQLAEMKWQRLQQLASEEGVLEPGMNKDQIISALGA